MLRFLRELPTSPVRFFIVVTIIFGSFFLLITPPLQGADETTHFLRAYQISEFNIIPDKNGNNVGGYLPSSVAETIEVIDPDKVMFNPNIKYQHYKTKRALIIKESGEKFLSFSGGATYSPASYIGISPTILITRLLGLPIIVVLYAGRVGALVVWTLLVAAAIAVIPRRKWVFVFIGLLPMALFQAVTINGDSIAIGSLMLFVGLILKYRQEKEVLDTKSLLVLFAVSVLMVLSKQAMFIFLPLILLLKGKSFSSQRTHLIVKIGLILVPFVCFLIWTLLIQDINNTAPVPNEGNPSSQLRFIIMNPHSFINVLWNTHFYTWGDSITRSLVGTFGWGDTSLSFALVSTAYIGGSFIVLGTSNIRDRLLTDRNEKILLAILGLGYWAAVNASLYLYYSPVGYKIVYGLQGRYFIPLLVLLLPFMATRKIKIDPVLYKKITVFLPLFLLATSTITIFVRYYVNNV